MVDTTLHPKYNENEAYSVDTVLGKTSMDLILHWQPPLGRMLSFFLSRYDKDCSLLTKALEIFDHERRLDPEFRDLYAGAVGPPDGVRSGV